MKLSKLNQKGFSLVELMVVVAIIGILATIGIPQYQKFMAKARQSEAKTHLNGIFQGESSFFTEYNLYTTNMRSIGAAAIGNQLRYNAGFATLADCGATYVNPAAPADGTNANNDLEAIDTADGTATTWLHAGTLVDIAAGSSLCTANASYTASAWGNPTGQGAGACGAPNNATCNGDVFTMNNNRVLQNTVIGL